MKKLTGLICMICTCLLMYAQEKKITGTITDQNGLPVENASIRLKSSGGGVSADAKGMFTINAKAGDVLIISAIGFENMEITIGDNSTAVSARMIKSEGQLSEVVVTALGIRKRPREVGYATASVRSDQITVANNPSLASALSGKLTGLVVTNVNSSVQADTRFVLRGNRSLTGNNQALVVVDGVPVSPNTLSYLNPNDVENVSILKGGQAATLYGSEGSNGVLVVTTKRGAKGKTQVNFTSSVTMEQVSFLPQFQNRFGSGSGYDYDPTTNYRSYENQSYGDEYDGSMRPLGRTLEDGSVMMVPYSARPDEKRKVWDNGSIIQNDISIAGGDERSSFYLSFQDARTNGVVPGDTRQRDVIRFNAGRNYGKFKASFQSSFTQDNFERTSTDFYTAVLNAAAHIPLRELRDWRNNKFANPNGYYNDYVNNPWFNLDNFRSAARNRYFNGSIELNFAPTKALSATYRIGLTNQHTEGNFTQGQFIYTNYARTQARVPDGFPQGGAGIFRAASNITGGVTNFSNSGSVDRPGDRINSDILINFQKELKDISIQAVLGNNIQQKRNYTMSVGSNSIVIPDLYNISNRTGELTGDYASYLQRKYGFYTDATIGFRDLVFVHASVRRDATSLFYADDRKESDYQYWYYGADVSVIVSDLIPSLKTDFFNYMKVRASLNKNANDNINPYSLNMFYNIGPGFPYGSMAGTTVGNTLPSPDLVPEQVKSYEAGAEISLWRSRISLDLSYYYQVSEGQIINIGIARPTGYSNAIINAGRLDNRGFEAEVKLQALKSSNLSWDIAFNYSYNTNEVKSLYGDLTSISLSNQFTETGGVVTAQVMAEVGQPFPLLRTTAFEKDEMGRIIVDRETGNPSRAANFVPQGSTIPKNTLGITSRLVYKDFSLSTTIEYRGGYYLFHGLGSSMTFTGTSTITTQYGRENFVIPNSVYDDGTGKYVPNTTVAVTDGHYGFWDNIYKFAGENYTTRGDFWKLRELNLTYSLSPAIVQKIKFIKAASLSLIGRNLLLILPGDNIYTDPEFANTTGNSLGINTTLNTPPVRSYGVTLNVTF